MGAVRLHHVALKAKDPEALARFYREVVGLSEQTRHHDDRGLRSVWLRLEPGILMIERAGAAGIDTPYDSDPPGFHLLALHIPSDEANAWRAKLRVLRESAHTLYAADPEGNRIALSSWPEPLAR